MSQAMSVNRLQHRVEHALLNPDVAVALRGALALATAWSLCVALGKPSAGMVAAMTAQNVSYLQVRGDYWARLILLLLLMGVMALWVYIGTVGHNLWVATAMTGVLALASGGWRHASADFGPQFGIASALMFFVGLSHPATPSHGLDLMGAAGIGGGVGILFQISGWFFRPQHAIRQAAAEAWVAASDLIQSLRNQDGDRIQPPDTANIMEKEFAMRATLDRSFRALNAVGQGRPGLVQHLDDMLHLAARLTTRVTAFHVTLEPLRATPEFTKVEAALDTVFRTLVNLTRSAALTLVHHRSDHFAAFSLRLRRAEDLVRVLDARLGEAWPGEQAGAARDMLAQVNELFPVLRTSFSDTIDRGSARSIALPRLPDLGQQSLRTLGVWINPATQLDPTIVRYSLRAALLMMPAIAAYLAFEIPRGYWVAFTVLVVLQPDFGATRLKAGQRIVGTVAGSLVGSLLLWVHLPLPLVITCAALLSFGFGYFLKRRYSVAVFFVTLMLVLMMESIMPVHIDFTIARTLATLVGGGMALGAAMFLWPAWEEGRSPRLLIAALRANRRYLEVVGEALGKGDPILGAPVEAKRAAERANSRAAAGLQRLLAQPGGPGTEIGPLELLIAYNQRLTRAISVFSQQLNRRQAVAHSEIDACVGKLAATIEALAASLEGKTPFADTLSPSPSLDPDAPLEARKAWEQLGRIATEIDAMKAACAGSQVAIATT